jgi:hypothetical protein
MNGLMRLCVDRAAILWPDLRKKLRSSLALARPCPGTVHDVVFPDFIVSIRCANVVELTAILIDPRLTYA